MTIYFDDFVAGQVFESGDVVVTEEEIIEFANRYDPQPFHINPEAAEDTVEKVTPSSKTQLAAP